MAVVARGTATPMVRLVGGRQTLVTVVVTIVVIELFDWFIMRFKLS